MAPKPGLMGRWKVMVGVAGWVGLWPVVILGLFQMPPPSAWRLLLMAGSAVMIGGALGMMFEAGRLRERAARDSSSI